MFSGLANAVSKHSKLIVVAWIAVLLVSVPFMAKSGDVLVYDMTEMSGSSTESSQGSAIMKDYFDNSMDLSDILVIEYGDASQMASAQAIYVAFSGLMADKYGDKLTVSSYGTYSKAGETGGIYLVAISNNAEGFDIGDETGNIRGIVSEAKESVGATNPSYLTGSAPIGYDTEKSSMEDVAKVDPLSIALIFVLLGLFFYALVTAVLPPAVVGMAYGIVLMGLYFIGCILDIFYITQVLILVSMLGAGCDYAIFIITRYRDECRKGKSHDEALREAVVWGGEAVFTSGISVIIGFAALMLCNFSLVQTMGMILALGIAVALLAALTFIPSLINLLHDRIFWPSNIEKYKAVDEKVASGGKKGARAAAISCFRRYFDWLSRVTEKRAVPIVIVLALVAVPSIYYYTQTEDSADMISVMPDSESVDGLNVIMEHADGGMIMPTYVVLDLNAPIGTVGSVTLMGQTLPTVKWNEFGLSVNPSTGEITGAVPAIMLVSSQLAVKYAEEAGTISGVNSWQVVYLKTALALETADPATVNYAIITSGTLPAAVSQPVIAILAAASGQDPTHPDITSLTASYDSYIDAQGTTVANVIDGILNVSTGILNTAADHVAMMVVTSGEPMADETLDFIEELRQDFHGENGYDTAMAAVWSASYITGTPASMLDISSEVEGQFSMIRIVVAVLLIALLFFILGSYLTPIRGVIAILLSVIITVALTRLVFAELLSTPVLFLIPIVLFVVLLGLGMDYEIFLTTKIRENKTRGMDNHKAISQAIRDAGPVISLCALIMGGTFLTLVLAGSSMLKEFGFALGVGILIDGLLMVGFCSPAMMHLMGDWSWKGPGFLTKRHGMNPDGTAMEPAEEKSERSRNLF